MVPRILDMTRATALPVWPSRLLEGMVCAKLQFRREAARGSIAFILFSSPFREAQRRDCYWISFLEETMSDDGLVESVLFFTQHRFWLTTYVTATHLSSLAHIVAQSCAEPAGLS